MHSSRRLKQLVCLISLGLRTSSSTNLSSCVSTMWTRSFIICIYRPSLVLSDCCCYYRNRHVETMKFETIVAMQAWQDWSWQKIVLNPSPHTVPCSSRHTLVIIHPHSRQPQSSRRDTVSVFFLTWDTLQSCSPCDTSSVFFLAQWYATSTHAEWRQGQHISNSL